MDAPGIDALLRQAGLHPDTRPETQRWKYWQERADWPGSRSFLLTDDGEPVAHGAIVPGELAWRTGRARIVHLVDWAANPRVSGVGVVLMKRIAQLADGLLAVGVSALGRQILPHVGFKSVGAATGYVRTIRPGRILGSGSYSSRTLARFARSVVWTARAPARERDTFRVRRITSDTLRDLLAVLPTPVGDLAVFRRSEESLRYALACPLVPTEIHALERSGRVLGYFVLTLAGRQARLVDCWMDTAEPADWCSLILCAVQRAGQHPQVAELATWASDPLLLGCLSQSGFHPRITQAVLLMMRPGLPPPPATLRVQMLDSDAAYLYRPGEGLWA